MGEISKIKILILLFITTISWSQVSFAQTQAEKNFSEINQLESVNNVTAPINYIFHSILEYAQKGQNDPEGIIGTPIPLTGRLNVSDSIASISIQDSFKIVKSVFILAAQILVEILELALIGLKTILSIIT